MKKERITNKSSKGLTIFLTIGKWLLLIADILMIAMYVVFAFGSFLDVTYCLSPFVYVSFVLSLIILLLSAFSKFKRLAQKDKSSTLIMSIFIAFSYALIRVKFFPHVSQWEDIGTAAIIITSYFITVLEK